MFYRNTELSHGTQEHAFGNYNNLFFLVYDNIQDYLKLYIILHFENIHIPLICYLGLNRNT